MIGMNRAGAVVAIVVIAAIIATWIASRWQQSTLEADVDRLVQSGEAREVESAAAADALETLPPPVARYLRMALPRPEQIQQVRIRQTGTLRTDVTSQRWMPFDAEHIVVPVETGFVWNARVQIAPLIHVRVRDALIDGKGTGKVSLLSAFTVSAATDTPEMNSGSLHRYLAEAVWYPSALMPSSKLQWTQIDTTRALATLTDHGVTVSLEFTFADTGEVTRIYTPGRWGTFPGGYRQVPWEGHFRNYRERDGVVVPSEGDVGWYIENVWHAVWKGSITAYQRRTSP
jgi:hypothetical protein